MSRWIRKPYIVDAFQWTGGPDQVEDPEWMIESLKEGYSSIEPLGKNNMKKPEDEIVLKIKNGKVKGFPTCFKGQFIIKDGDGFLNVSSEESFLEMFDRVRDEE